MRFFELAIIVIEFNVSNSIRNLNLSQNGQNFSFLKKFLNFFFEFFYFAKKLLFSICIKVFRDVYLDNHNGEFEKCHFRYLTAIFMKKHEKWVEWTNFNPQFQPFLRPSAPISKLYLIKRNLNYILRQKKLKNFTGLLNAHRKT